MKNINLNPGGVIGALLMIAAVVIFVSLTSSTDSISGRIGGIGAPAVLLGAFGGNYLWDRVFTKRE